MNIIVDNLHLHYQDTGSGPVIVLLHGWQQSLGTFDELAAALGKTHRVIRLDLPGFGASQRPPNGWDVTAYAKCVQTFLQKLGVQKVAVLIGHSLGGRIAIKAVGIGLITPSRLVLMSSAGVKPPITARRRLLWVAAKAGKTATALPGLRRFRARLRQELYASAGATDYLRSGPLQSVFLNIINEDLQTDARHIGVPTLLIWGQEDSETPLAEGWQLHTVIGGSRLEVVQGAGHFCYTDQPARVLALIKEFEA